MNEIFTDLLDRIRDNLVSVMAVLLIVLILIGYLILTANSILPEWQNRTDLITRIAEANVTIEESNQTQQSSVDTLISKINNAPTQLENSANFLMTESEANRFMNILYLHAADTNVTIAEMQIQSTPNTESVDLYNIKEIQLKVDGRLDKLTEFLTRIEVASQPGYILKNIAISEGVKEDTLTMIILLFTSAYASDDSSLTSTDSFLELNSDVDQLPSPGVEERQPVSYVVRSGDTLLLLSRQFNVSMAKLREVNNLSVDGISPDQELHIPR